MKNNKGFFTIEAIASFHIFLTIMLTLIPIIYQLKAEQETLSERRYAQTQLHGQLLEYLYAPENPSNELTIEMADSSKQVLTIQFLETGDKVKGCAEWTNAKENSERFCIYGKKE